MSNKSSFHPISHLHNFNMYHHEHKIVVLWSDLVKNSNVVVSSWISCLKKIYKHLFSEQKSSSRSLNCSLITTKCIFNNSHDNIARVIRVICTCIMISLYIIHFKHITESAGEDIDECLITLLEWEMRYAQQCTYTQMIQVDRNECRKGKRRRRE